MAQDFGGLQTELQTMKQELLDSIVDVRKYVERVENRLERVDERVERVEQHVERIDTRTQETDRKVQYLCDHLLGDLDRAELRRAGGQR